MAIALIDHGAFRLEAKYLQQRGGIYFFRRRIPVDVKRLYPNAKGFLVFSLKTRDLDEAAKKAHQFALEQDALWRAHKSGQNVTSKDQRLAAEAILQAHDLKPGQIHEYRRAGIEPDAFLDELRYQSQSGTGEIIKENLPEQYRLAADLLHGEKTVPHFSDAVDHYENLKTPNQSDKSKRDRQRVVEELFAVAGDLPIDQYARKHGNMLVSRLLEAGNKTATVKRKLNYIVPVLAFALREFEVGKDNVFENLTIPKFGGDTKKRLPYDSLERSRLLKFYLERDDDMRWIPALLHDTGARLSEVLGLRTEDIVLNSSCPHIIIQGNDLRRLKSKQSERRVPLVGISLWAARQAVSNADGNWVFTRFIKDGELFNTHASNSINKSLKGVVPRKTVHSLRHAFRDRLRDVECPSSLIDELGGWATQGVGSTYGQGTSLDVKLKWMRKIESRIEGAVAGPTMDNNRSRPEEK